MKQGMSSYGGEYKGSAFFDHISPSFLDFSRWSSVNVRQFLRTIGYLDPRNPYLHVSREELLADVEVDAQLDTDRILSLFGDGLSSALWRRERNVLKEGGYAIFSIFPILEAVVALREKPPVGCPISKDKLDELLEQLLILELSAANSCVGENQNYNNKAIIEGMRVGQRRMIAAASEKHAWVIEVRKESETIFLVTYLNSGAGLETFHRKSQNMFEYFAQYRMTLGQISSLDYFANYHRKTSNLYPISGRLDKSLYLSDLISGQKMGTCHTKGILVALKWFFREIDPSNSTYIWWKVWHLNYRVPQIKVLLKGRSTLPTVNGIDHFSLSRLVINHQVIKLRKIANQLGHFYEIQFWCYHTLQRISNNERCSEYLTIQPLTLWNRIFDYFYPANLGDWMFYGMVILMIWAIKNPPKQIESPEDF